MSPASGGKAIHTTGNDIFAFARPANGDWRIPEQTFTELEPIGL